MKIKLSASLMTILALLLLLGASGAYAATYTICDNDPLATNCNMYFNVSPHHYTYKSGSGYNNDHRHIQNSSYPDEYAVLEFSRPSGNFSGGTSYLYVHVVNSFTSRSTTYSSYVNGSVIGNVVGTIDQYNSPNGWNYVGAFTISSSGAQYVEIELSPGGTGTQKDGLDAMEIITQ